MRALLALSLLVGSLEAAAQCPARSTPWPTDVWPSRADAVAVQRAAEIAALETQAFTLHLPDKDRIGPRTDGVVIIQGGQLVYEKYARGFTPTMRHLSWSVSKSFTNALTGIAVRRGVIALNDSICAHATTPQLTQDKCTITVQNLLEMASGLDWHETYEGKSNQASSVLGMLYGLGHNDIAGFTVAHPFRDPPGTSWEYSSGDANVLMHVVGNVLEEATQTDRYPWTELFDPIGMKSARFERDPRGTYVGSSYVYATPQDLARFGYFLLNDGCWNGTQLLPTGWVADSTAVNAPFMNKRVDWEEGDVYGRQFWLNKPVPELQIPTPWPDVPTDAYAALGHWGQSITVIPSLDLVVVRVADDRDGSFDRNEFLKLAIAVGQP